MISVFSTYILNSLGNLLQRHLLVFKRKGMRKHNTFTNKISVSRVIQDIIVKFLKVASFMLIKTENKLSLFYKHLTLFKATNTDIYWHFGSFPSFNLLKLTQARLRAHTRTHVQMCRIRENPKHQLFILCT